MTYKRSSHESVDSLSGLGNSRGVKTLQSRRLTRTNERTRLEARPAESKKSSKIVSFELKLPKIRKPDLPYRRLAMIAGAILIILLLIVVVKAGVERLRGSSEANVDIIEEPLPTKPQFETVVPEAAKKSDKQVNYDAEKRVASFYDTIGGVDVTVSEQALPDNFRADPTGETEKLAKSFRATKRLVAGEITAFTGISSEDGTQTVVFAKKDLLIFIRAVKELDNSSLAQYIANLE